jgi:hypothetical protein
MKLQVLNKHHLQLLWSNPEGLEGLAQRVLPLVKEAFPSRCDLFDCPCSEKLWIINLYQ